MNAAVPLRDRVLAAVAARPSLTRRQGRRLGAILTLLSIAVALAVFLAAGGPARALASPLRERARLADGWALASTALGWLLFSCACARPMARSSVPWLRTATGASPVVLVSWVGRAAGEGARWGDALSALGLTLAMAATPLAAFLFLRRGAEPLYPGTLGAAAGATCGAVAQVLVVLGWPAGAWPHALVGHALPLLVLTALGAVLGRRRLGATPDDPDDAPLAALSVSDRSSP